MPGSFSRLATAKKRHKSTTDITYRGHMCLPPPSTLGQTDREQAFLHHCSLRETNNVSHYPRHALSVPNMGSTSPLGAINNSPMHNTPLSPAHSSMSSPAREMERLAKARSKLLESECNQTPTILQKPEGNFGMSPRMGSVVSICVTFLRGAASCLISLPLLWTSSTAGFYLFS